MSPSEINTLVENYVAAWSEPEANRRRELLELVWQANGTYTDPLAHASDRAGLDEIITTFLSRNTGAQFTLNGQPDHHHQHIRFYWTLRLANGRELPGMDYGEISTEGKLLKIVGFF
jgi:hypothetical protein